MKKNIYSLALLTALAATSCSHDIENTPLPTSPQKEPLTLTLSLNKPIKTRAFFDDSATLEPWERELHEVVVLLMNVQDGSVLFRRDLTPSEIDTGEVTLRSSSIKVGDNLVIAAIANFDVPTSFDSFMNLDSLFSTFNIAECNGTFAEVAQGSKRSKGMLMVADANGVVTEDGGTFNLDFESNIAKVAIELSLSDSFQDNYPGSLRVNSVTVSNTPAHSNEEASDFTHTQQSNMSGGLYQNLFYILESTAHFSVNATYDSDGDFSTTSDQRTVEYSLPIEDEYGNPQHFKLHSYYRVRGEICGLGEPLQPFTIAMRVVDWANVEDFNIAI